jgi:CelD/BcsL family acetyltransferase involved in cellulose biosynthesis
VNVRGAFSNPKMKEFYRDIASQFLKNKWLYFTCLTVDNEPVSIEYGFIYNQKLYNATAARDIKYSEYSVGHLHHLFLIKDAIKRHLREFDFLRGDEPYKFYWTKSARRYIQVMIKKNGFGSGLSLKLIRLSFRLREVCQYSLREIYSLYLIKRREKKQKKQMGLDRLI